jgi:hypothetical protein
LLMMDCFGVERNGDGDGLGSDQRQAGREAEARGVLLAAGADRLERRPWQVGAMPPSAVDLIQFFLWQSRSAAFGAEEVDQELGDAMVAALRLLPAARAEIDQLETGLLFAARGLGLTWAQMADALGLNSPQACQQRLDRLTARVSRPAEGLTP